MKRNIFVGIAADESPLTRAADSLVHALNVAVDIFRQCPYQWVFGGPGAGKTQAVLDLLDVFYRVQRLHILEEYQSGNPVELRITSYRRPRVRPATRIVHCSRRRGA